MDDYDGHLSRDLSLSADDRFDVWQVKKEERPHLLENEEEKHENEPLPLIDGCDVPNWRRSQLVQVSEYHQGILNVGSGCSLLRRESQFPVLSSRATKNWNELRERLLQPPKSMATRIPAEEAVPLGPYSWFERDNVPAILEGCTATWKAMQSCSWDALVDRFGDYEWRFSDTHGACMTLSTYTKYVQSLEGQTDDAPLAVYDSQLDTDDRSCLIDDYTVPKCFDAPDLFQDVMPPDCSRSPPPYRWILMGPARSGTGLHVDPTGTHAWVTLIEGYKRWVLFPFGTDQASIGMQTPQIPSALWFANHYQSAMEKYPNAVEILQRPGETVYVPAGWPHLVLNLDRTVAITQNYATEYPSLQRLAEAVQNQEPEFYVEWLEALQAHRPDLVAGLSRTTTRSSCVPRSDGSNHHSVVTPTASVSM